MQYKCFDCNYCWYIIYIVNLICGKKIIFLDGEIKKQFEWLKSHFEPEETVLQYWEGTAEVRHQNPNDVWKHLEPLKHNIGKKLVSTFVKIEII